MKKITVVFFIFMIFMDCVAQDRTLVSNRHFYSGLKQIKESANFGLVFTGPNVNYGHYWSFLKNNGIFIIENDLGVCIPFSKGIPALNVYLKPVEFSWLYIRKSTQNSFSVGPLAKVEYDYTLYPQLQSAFDYWFTNISLGLNSAYKFHLANQSLTARFKFSVCGFTSRQAGYRNPYYYDIGFKHAIRHLNSNLEFSTLNKYNTTNLEFTWNPQPDSRFIWAYSFNYSGYFDKPAISIMNHSIKLTVVKKKNKS